MARDGIVRLLAQPVLEDLDRLVDLAKRAVRQGQQPPRFGIFGLSVMTLQKQTVASAAPLAVQQDAEVVVRIGVSGVDADGRPIRRLRLGHLPCARRTTPRLLCALA